MKLNEDFYCDQCKKKCTDEGLWVAKDGHEYCDYCYRFVFYPKFYGLIRDWR